jgi:MFS superfamily sulfate permease-like transporter
MATLTRATVTLLLAAVGILIAWQLVQRVLPALLVVLALLGVYRIALGVSRRDRW